MEDTVNVTTHIETIDLEMGTNYQVKVTVKSTGGTNPEWTERFPDGFACKYDHKTYAEACKTLQDVNKSFGMPAPPIPTAEQLRGMFR